MTDRPRIGLALSGGGVRAAGFHLGVLARLAREDYLEDVVAISTVSGGSLGVGLVYALAGMRWPTSREFLEVTLPEARRVMTSTSLQSLLLWRFLRQAIRHPTHLFGTRADDLSALLRRNWGITASLQDVPDAPRWMINATCYETAKNWRFLNFRMGDYAFGYTEQTDIPLSDALAASAGFPGLIGPLVFSTKGRDWFKYVDSPAPGAEVDDRMVHRSRRTQAVSPAFRRLHLWDGGVYDNLGAEGVHAIGRGWKHGIEFLITSDAGGQPGPEAYRVLRVPLRIIIGVMMDQIRSLRSRVLIDRIVHRRDGDRGVVLRTGNTCAKVLRDTPHRGEIDARCPSCLTKEAAKRAAHIATSLKRLSPDDFELLFRHGFEVANCTLYGYNDDLFGYVER